MHRLVALALLAAPAAPDSRALPALDPASISETLFLVGDTGHPAKGRAVLIALAGSSRARLGRATVAFLGDNVYSCSLPAPGDPEMAEMERRLDDQVDMVRDAGVRAIFIPGNHDWAKGARDGWERVRREERRVEERGGASVSYLPNDGCPGPEVVDIGERVRLVVLDTQWWLHAGARPEHPTSSCSADSEPEVVGGLRAALEGASGRDVVVLAHHPLRSGGPHGGRFGLKQHLFPLTEVGGPLWLPLPIIGSLYPLARSSGVSPQDQ
jgi:hypothetical protein